LDISFLNNLKRLELTIRDSKDLIATSTNNNPIDYVCQDYDNVKLPTHAKKYEETVGLQPYDDSIYIYNLTVDDHSIITRYYFVREKETRNPYVGELESYYRCNFKLSDNIDSYFDVSQNIYVTGINSDKYIIDNNNFIFTYSDDEIETIKSNTNTYGDIEIINDVLQLSYNEEIVKEYKIINIDTTYEYDSETNVINLDNPVTVGEFLENFECKNCTRYGIIDKEDIYQSDNVLITDEHSLHLEYNFNTVVTFTLQIPKEIELSKPILEPEVIYDNIGGKINLTSTLKNIISDKVNVEVYKEGKESIITKEFSINENIANIELDIPSGIEYGTYMIKVTAGEYEKTETFEVTKYVLIENITLDKDSITLLKGTNETLNVTITPDTASNKKLLWKSSNNDVATINENGVVTGISIGKATITVSNEEGNILDECMVTVMNSLNSDIETEKYKLDNTFTINKIKDKLIFDNFITDFAVNSSVVTKVFNNDTEIDYSKSLGTGYKLRTYSNDELINEYTLIVSGDLDGNGQANASDILKMKMHILGKSTLENIVFTAGDIDESNSVNATDIIYLKRYILGKSDNVWGS